MELKNRKEKWLTWFGEIILKTAIAEIVKSLHR